MAKPSFKSRARLAWKALTGNRSFFMGAAIGRLTSDFVNVVVSADAAIFGDLEVMRARARDLERSNGYARKALEDLSSKIVGPYGFALQSKVLLSDGTLNKVVNDAIEQAWKKWLRMENCTTTKRLPGLMMQRAVLRTALRDGEVLARKVKGFNNKFGFSLQLIEPDFLDHNFNDPARNIRMGVQYNSFGEPVTYWLLKKHPGDMGFGAIPQDQKYDPTPASDIIHVYLPDRIGQSRGMSVFVAAMRPLNHLGQYCEAEVVAARVQAAQQSYLERVVPEGWGGETDDKGQITTEMEPGVTVELPMGYTVKMPTATHPNSGFGGAVMAFLRHIASCLGVAYSTLSSDYSQANYSSERAQQLDLRAGFQFFQQWYLETFLCPVFEAWLEPAILSGQLKLPISQAETFYEAVEFIGRKFEYIDPTKDIAAAAAAVKEGFTSRRAVCAENGDDFETIVIEQSQDQEIAEENGVKLGEQPEQPSKAGPTEPPEDDPPNPDPEEESRDFTRKNRKATPVYDANGQMTGMDITEQTHVIQPIEVNGKKAQVVRTYKPITKHLEFVRDEKGALKNVVRSTTPKHDDDTDTKHPA